MRTPLVAMAQLRLLLWKRDGGMCGICRQPVGLDDMHIDHIVPVSMGGEGSLANLQPTHPRCNLLKGGRDRLVIDRLGVSRPNQQACEPSPPASTMEHDATGCDIMQDDERFMTVDEVAARLRVDPETVRRMLRTGRLEGVRLGGRKAGWRISSAAVTHLLRGKPRRTPTPAAAPVPPSPLDIGMDLAHARAEAEWARRDGDLAEAARWEQIAAGIATSPEA